MAAVTLHIWLNLLKLLARTEALLSALLAAMEHSSCGSVGQPRAVCYCSSSNSLSQIGQHHVQA